MKKPIKFEPAPGTKPKGASYRPDSARFDPGKVAFWTYPMVIAWISWRDLDAVRTFWDEYRKFCWDHVPRTANGVTIFDMKHWEPANIRVMGAFVRRASWAASDSAASDAPKAPSVPLGDAIQSVRAAASEGKVSAIALDLEGNEVKIEAYSWSRLEVRNSDKWFELPIYVGDRRRYTDARFPRDEVMAVWPTQNPAVETQAIAESEINLRSSPGKKKGQGSYAALDEPLLDEMAALLKNLSVASPEEAAKRVATRAHGAGTIESKVERLAKRFRKRTSQNSA
ncbi:hypothetical protein ACYCVF_18260 [Bradyrhizobium sp. 1.29L]